MKRFICLVAVCLAAPLMGRAQDAASNPVAASVRKVFDEYAKDLVATAEIMPEDKYSFKPTPENMTFGKTIGHIAEVNNAVCSKLFTPPAAPFPKSSDADPKAKLVAGLKASMDYCGEQFSKMTDANLSEMVPFFGGRQITRMGAALAVITDFADHYAGLSMHLRMNGLLPPTAQKK
jgi:DinB family protein